MRGYIRWRMLISTDERALRAALTSARRGTVAVAAGMVNAQILGVQPRLPRAYAGQTGHVDSLAWISERGVRGAGS